MLLTAHVTALTSTPLLHIPPPHTSSTTHLHPPSSDTTPPPLPILPPHNSSVRTIGPHPTKRSSELSPCSHRQTSAAPSSRAALRRSPTLPPRHPHCHRPTSRTYHALHLPATRQRRPVHRLRPPRCRRPRRPHYHRSTAARIRHRQTPRHLPCLRRPRRPRRPRLRRRPTRGPETHRLTCR